MSHPGITRLISHFRYSSGIYMVLEFAARGDIHSMVVKAGPLSPVQVRFVVGETIAALISVHDHGFAFGDLKPENLVITDRGHVKLTDFGTAIILAFSPVFSPSLFSSVCSFDILILYLL